MQPNDQQLQPSQEPLVSPTVVVSPEGGVAQAPALPQQPLPAQPLFDPAAAVPAAEAPVSGGKKFGLKTALVVVAFVAVFVGGFYARTGWTNALHGRATAAAQDFIAALNNGDNAKAYGMTTNNIRGAESADEFASNMGNLKAAQPVLAAQKISFNGSKATYSVVEGGLPATGSGSTDGTFSITLVKSGLANWKIDSVSVQ